ncbi:hypothetical protein A2U01_0072928, partial [Trifolium medium]|nr:hypothetical protein [Trifolium medium]
GGATKSSSVRLFHFVGVVIFFSAVDLHHVDRVEVVFKRCCGFCWCCLVVGEVSLRPDFAVEFVVTSPCGLFRIAKCSIWLL